MAVVAVCIAYEQLAVTQCGIFIEYAIFQNYVADFACGCGYFAVFIYREFLSGCMERTVAVYKERHGPIPCHLTYVEIIFGIQCIGINSIGINSSIRCLCLAHSHNASKSKCS